METLQTLIANVRIALQEPTADKWTDNEIALAISEKQREIGVLLSAHDEGEFQHTADLSLTTESSYDLPPNFLRAINIEYYSSGSYSPTDTTTARDHWRYAYNASLITHASPVSAPIGWRIMGRKLVVDAASSVSGGTLRLWYVRRLPTLHYGTCQSNAVATQIILAASPTAGTIAFENDYYLGAWVYANSELRQITDYVSSTKVAAVSPTFTSAPTASTYGILCEIDEEWMPLVETGATADLLIKSGERDMRAMMAEKYNALLTVLFDNYSPRQAQGNHRTNSAARSLVSGVR